MTNVEALKKLCAAIKTTNGEATTADAIPGTTSAEVILEIAKIYGYKEPVSGELGSLTLTSAPGTETGTSKFTVTGTTGTTFKYTTGTVETPEYHEDLTSWTDWDGVSDITVDDGVKVTIAEVNGSGLAIAVGATTANSNV